MSTQREITFAQAVNEAMCEEMRRDPDVFLMGEDVGVYRGAFGVTQTMYEEFGDRVIDTPISEAGFVGLGIGAAMKGLRPIIEIMFSDFISVCYDMILNQAAKMHFMFAGKVSVPLVIRTAAGCGTGAAAQHSQSLEAMLCHIPGLKVIAPSTPHDAKGLLKSAIRDNNPVIFLEEKTLYREKGRVPDGDYTVPIGEADVKRIGKDATIATYGRMVEPCLRAAERLFLSGIDVEVVDLRTLLPMDKPTLIESVKKTKRLLIVHEAVKTGGLGAEIAASIAESDAFFYLDSPIRRLAAEDMPVPFSAVLERGVLPDEEKIYTQILGMVGT